MNLKFVKKFEQMKEQPTNGTLMNKRSGFKIK